MRTSLKRRGFSVFSLLFVLALVLLLAAFLGIFAAGRSISPPAAEKRRIDEEIRQRDLDRQREEAARRAALRAAEEAERQAERRRLEAIRWLEDLKRNKDKQ